MFCSNFNEKYNFDQIKKFIMMFNRKVVAKSRKKNSLKMYVLVSKISFMFGLYMLNNV